MANANGPTPLGLFRNPIKQSLESDGVASGDDTVGYRVAAANSRFCADLDSRPDPLQSQCEFTGAGDPILENTPVEIATAGEIRFTPGSTSKSREISGTSGEFDPNTCFEAVIEVNGSAVGFSLPDSRHRVLQFGQDDRSMAIFNSCYVDGQKPLDVTNITVNTGAHGFEWSDLSDGELTEFQFAETALRPIASEHYNMRAESVQIECAPIDTSEYTAVPHAQDSQNPVVPGIDVAPLITINSPLKVARGSSGNTLDGEHLRGLDFSGSPGLLGFRLETRPANGTLRRLNSILAPGDTFTQSDIDSGLISYEHHGTKTTNDTCVFTLLDNGGTVADSCVFNMLIGTARPAPVSNQGHYSVERGGMVAIPAEEVWGEHIGVGDAGPTTTVTVGPVNGILVLNLDGSFTYAHDGSETSVDRFTCRLTDLQGISRSSTVQIEIVPVTLVQQTNRSVGSVAESLAASSELNQKSGAVKDIEPVASIVREPGHADSFAVADDGAFAYVPQRGFRGQDQFAYRFNTVRHGGRNVVATAAVVGIGAPSPITADPKSTVQQLTFETLDHVFSIGGCDSNPDPLKAVLVDLPTHGDLKISPEGSLAYLPAPGFSGTDSITYASLEAGSRQSRQLTNLRIEVSSARWEVPARASKSGENDLLPPNPNRSAADTSNCEITWQAIDVLRLGPGPVNGEAAIDQVLANLGGRNLARNVLQAMVASTMEMKLDGNAELNWEKGSLATVFDASLLWCEIIKRDDPILNPAEVLGDIDRISVAATAGCLFWSLRAGVLLAAAMQPATNCRFIDPRPAINRWWQSRDRT